MVVALAEHSDQLFECGTKVRKIVTFFKKSNKASDKS